MSKSVPLSLRISSEDAEFIANLQISGAITPSDKIRAIIKEAKNRREQPRDYANSRNYVNEALSHLRAEITRFELEQNQYSELINQFNDWLADAFAFINSFNIEPQAIEEGLRRLEQGIVKRIFRLIETITRMGVTLKAPCYDRDIIRKEMETLIELSTLIHCKFKREKENE